MVPPPVGAPEPAIESYLSHLRADIRHTQGNIKQARRADQAAEAEHWAVRMAEKKVLYREERERLTERDTGLMAGGIVVTSVGGASTIASITLALVWVMSGVFGPNNDDFKTASFGTLAGGLAGLSAGIPMMLFGNQRTPRQPEGPPPIWHGARETGRTGATLGLSF